MESTVVNVADYAVQPSPVSIESVFDRINSEVFWNFCQPDSDPRVEALDGYRSLLEKLADLDIETIPFCEAPISRAEDFSKVRCLIRHDLDLDIVAALRMAEIEAEFGVRSSWYVLHTGKYYGEFLKNRTFERYVSMRHVYRRLQDLGHEVALHTDALWVYQRHHVDGAQALRAEIEWLRESGLDIVGTTAHNSWEVYGAENFAIFEGKPQNAGALVEDCPPFVSSHGGTAPLQILNERELGLEYEANEIHWQSHTPVRSAALSGRNEWHWTDKHSRIVTEPLGGWTGRISTGELYENLERIPPGNLLVLVIHPVYYGWRHAPHAEPARSIEE